MAGLWLIHQSLIIVNALSDTLCCFCFSSIIAAGGQNETSMMDSVEVYDIASNLWTVKTPLPQALRCMTAVSYKGSLYLFGGESEKEITRAAYR